MSDYRYPAVATLAATFLPRNRETQARAVDAMLAARDVEIEQLRTAVTRGAEAIGRYMHENAELRGWIGRARAILAEGHLAGKGLDSHLVIVVGAVDRVLEMPIPGAGAKPKRPLYHPFKERVQLCAECDRPNLCAVLRKGTAPCGKNELVELAVEEVRR